MTDVLPPEDWPDRATSRIVPCAPHHWHVQVTGRGRDILMLHGAGASSHSWFRLRPLLQDRFRLISVDLPGHGFTRSPKGRASLAMVARDIATLAAQEGWAPDAIVGHSAGAAIALEIARQRRLAPKQVVAINGALEDFRGTAGWLFPVIAQTLALNPFAGFLISYGSGAESQVRSIIGTTGSTLDAEALGHYAFLIRRRAHVEGTLAMMAQWSLHDLSRALPRIDVPVLFLHGETDSAVAPKVAERAAAALPDARLIVLPGIGHLAQEEAPEEVARNILEFVCPVSPAPAQ